MLTEAEISRYEQLVSDAKRSAGNGKVAKALFKQYRNKKARKLAMLQGISLDEAKKLVSRHSIADLEAEHQSLYFEDIIEIDGEPMLVSELFKRGEEFDRRAMPDPIEGSSYGTTTAMYFHNDGISPLIHSFAHGVKTLYWIKVNKWGDGS